MTISHRNEGEESYWNRLVDLLRNRTILEIIEDAVVKEKCALTLKDNQIYKDYLQTYTQLRKHVSITDFRPLGIDPSGNRFLVYSLFPECSVNVKIRYADKQRDRIALSVGHSIFNPNCNVNVGKMLSKFEGGGHRGAGSCRFHVSRAEDYINGIIDILLKNEALEEK